MSEHEQRYVGDDEGAWQAGDEAGARRAGDGSGAQQVGDGSGAGVETGVSRAGDASGAQQVGDGSGAGVETGVSRAGDAPGAQQVGDGSGAGVETGVSHAGDAPGAQQAGDEVAARGSDNEGGGQGTDPGAGTTPLLPEADLQAASQRWHEIQSGFVDDPRRAVADADALVGVLVQQITRLFDHERAQFEALWDRGDHVSTEELRVGLQRYRNFFERLLST